VTPTNADIAHILRRYAAVLSLQGADRFKLKAYRRAAETIEGLHEGIAQMVESGRDLTGLPGVGKAINHVISEIVTTGSLARLEKSVSAMPAEQSELLSRPALDPKSVARIYKKLGINRLGELRKALDTGQIRDVFGARMDFHIRRGLDDRPRNLLWSIEDFAEQVQSFIEAIPGVRQVSPAGSLRRKQDTVGDLNFLVTGKNSAQIFKRFSGFGAVQSSEAAGPAIWIYALSSGMKVSLRWTPADEWGLNLVDATGSQGHLNELATKAKAMSLAVTKQTLRETGADLSDEKNVYSILGLQFIPPELREGRGEVATAARRRLPTLIRLEDIRGDLHMHTTESDGANSIAEMAEAARDRGYDYIAITDHSQSLKITNGLSEKRLRQHIRAIDQLNAKLRGFRVLKSAEVDILEDGTLDYSNPVLKELDLTVCSIHSRFARNREQQTERIMRAMDNPYFSILGHATGRLLLKREGYELDIERIIRHAKENGCFLEINSSPNRLDLSDEHAKLAKEAKVLVAVNTDAHSIRELDFMSAGINQARRGWLSAKDVLNTRPVDDLLHLLRRA
jgi:DNA polymerase (family 10)